MGYVQTFIGTLIIENCCNCGVTFGLEKDLYNRRREDHKDFYCPNGHGQHYTGKSETEKAKDELAQANKRIENLHSVLADKNDKIHHLKYSNRALKAAKTKIINRVKNGVCPCCNRTFKNLQGHFKSKHPELLQKDGQ